jgi:arginine decarboxylase
MTKEITKEDIWTVEDSENLYRVKLWGESYFYVNEEGHLAVRPILGDSIGIDVYKVVQDLKQQRIQFPLLIRFQDLLRSRVTELSIRRSAGQSKSQDTEIRTSAFIRSK